MATARLDDKGRLLTGPCACGAAQAPFGWGGDLTADPPRLGTWRCLKCWLAWLAALADAGSAPAGAAREDSVRMRWLARLLRGPLLRLAERRPPDFVIGGAADPYLERWYVIPRNRVFNVYLHRFVRSDDDRALHDHPWPSLGLILRGWYFEWQPARGLSALEAARADRHVPWSREEGSLRLRLPWTAHRVEIVERLRGQVWTLFITGPRVRTWGFWCPHGWRRWQDFTAGPRGEAVGRGCD